MQENLVIVESPAKAKTIEKFLGKDYKVMSSYGHIRDLKKKEISIDMNTLEPDYEIPEEKKKLVSELKSNAKKASKIWLASDEDREGEAISWHLCEVLGLDEEKTNRIVFHEITKTAILDAIKNPRHLDMNLVNAQQARRVIDRLVGFKLSPVLWRKVKPLLSAGRVQSVAVRLIVEREREIQNFKSEPYYKIAAVFTIANPDESLSEVKAELDTRFKTHDRKLGFSVSQTMMVAQHLYENGHITYMRTDSVNLSALCINTSKEEIVKHYGEEYSRPRKFQTHSKGAQEAHEAIRPTYMSNISIEGTAQEKKLYELIWKRTAASQMADAQIEKTTVEIELKGQSLAPTLSSKFIATGEVITFDGFLKVYRESTDEEENGQEETINLLPSMKKGDVLTRKEITATERFSQGPIRYTEASLVHKLEELGIGRPSTYAPTISTIQQRDYVHKGDKKGEERLFSLDTLRGNKITTRNKKEIVGNEKGKLLPTDIGTVVNDFLMENFPNIMDYNFTANIEEKFDSIAEGKAEWMKTTRQFYKGFEPEVEKVIKARSAHKAGERLIGKDPKTGKPVYAKIGRFGPVIQIGSAEDNEKPLFSQMPTDKSVETITLEEALELFKLPRTLGEFEGSAILIGAGRFGPYVLHDKKYVSIPKGTDPMTISLEEAVDLINGKRQQEQQRHLKSFEQDAEMEVLNGRYGPYISYNGKNYRMPKALHAKAAELTYEQCLEIVEKQKK